MHSCRYEVRLGAGCPNERTIDFEYCPEHLDTPRGRQHVMDVIATRNLTLPSEVEAAIQKAAEVPDKDYQTTALEKMVEALDRILEWEEESRRMLDLIPRDNWRFTDRSGSEQMRAEVGIYERAMDRTAKILSSMSKAALNEKMVTLGKAQVELMVRILMSLITELRLSNEQTDKARYLLLEMLERQANLTPRVENYARQELEPAQGVYIRGEQVISAQN